MTQILKAILSSHPNGHVVILDPNGEYAAAFEGMAEVIHPGNLQLPYWMMNLEEITSVFTSNHAVERPIEAAILRNVVLEARRNRAASIDTCTHVTVDSPVPFSLAEIERLLQVGMGRLEKPEGLAPYQRLIGRIQSLVSDRRLRVATFQIGQSESGRCFCRVSPRL